MEKRIEKYLAGKMTDTEKSAFEHELSVDSDLKQQVAENKLALAAIRLEGRSKMKSRFSRLDQEPSTSIESKKKTFFPRRAFYIIVGLLMLSFALWLLTQKDESPIIPKPEITPEPKKEIIIAEESTNKVEEKITEPVPNALPKTKPQPKSPSQSRTIKNERLFAANFEPYHHASLNPGIRGNEEDLTVREQLEMAYWEKDYNQVLSLWSDLSEKNQKNGNLLFLKANALMAKDSVVEAERDFEELISMKRHRFRAEAEWYAALATLHAGNISGTKTRLSGIIENPNHKFNNHAVKLLRQID